VENIPPEITPKGTYLSIGGLDECSLKIPIIAMPQTLENPKEEDNKSNTSS
jgi:hypothetical protein